MRSWQPVIGIFLGFLLGKYLSMALFWLPGIFIAGRNIGAGSIFSLASLLALITLIVVGAISVAIWLFVNFFAISSWLPKAAMASTLVSAAMMLWTVFNTIFCGILMWHGFFCRTPFWIGGWLF